MSQMKAFLHTLTEDGDWVPVRGDRTGSAPRRSNTAWTYVAAAGGITDTADVTLKAAPGIEYAVYLESLQIVNKSATATEVVVKSGASTVLWRGFAAANGVSPISIVFPDPLVADNNTAMTAACVTNATATLINAQGYTNVAYPQLQALATPGIEELFADDGTVLVSDTGEALTT